MELLLNKMLELYCLVCQLKNNYTQRKHKASLHNLVGESKNLKTDNKARKN